MNLRGTYLLPRVTTAVLSRSAAFHRHGSQGLYSRLWLCCTFNRRDSADQNLCNARTLSNTTEVAAAYVPVQRSGTCFGPGPNPSLQAMATGGIIVDDMPACSTLFPTQYVKPSLSIPLAVL